MEYAALVVRVVQLRANGTYPSANPQKSLGGHLGYVIEDLGPENFNQQLWWAVGTVANMEFTSLSDEALQRPYREPMKDE